MEEAVMGLRRLLARSIAVCVAAIGLAIATPAMAIPQASCVVNSTGDQANANNALGCDSTAGAGIITLRSAIAYMNNHRGNNTITFNLPSPSVIQLTTNELSIQDAGVLTIVGPGARALAIDGGNSTRVLRITPDGTVTANISGLTIRNGNYSGLPGGGIYIQSGSTVTLDRVAITGNSAGGGAGIDHEGVSLTMTNSTLTGNTITGAGCWAGAAMETSAGATSNLTNVTFTGNIADPSCFAGGAIFMCDAATFTNVTISGNTGPGGAWQGFRACNPTTVKNSIIANQAGSATVCEGTPPVDGGSNLSSDHSCGFATGATMFDLIDTDPMLSALANNGGTTDTMALKSGSPAIDAVKNVCPPPAADQRGLTRPVGSACDMGAFEFSPLKVTAVSATCGPIAGGGSVTINGTGLLFATQVNFGGRAAQSFTVVSDTQVDAVAPAGTSGQKVDITVTTPSGTSITGSPDQCTYAVSAAVAPTPPAVVPTLPAAGAPPVNRSPSWSLLLLPLIAGLAQLVLRRGLRGAR